VTAAACVHGIGELGDREGHLLGRVGQGLAGGGELLVREGTGGAPGPCHTGAGRGVVTEERGGRKSRRKWRKEEQ
jgi:hypothetical protein